MAFAYAGMTLKTFVAHELGSEDAVTDVGFGAETVYARGVGEEDAYVMEHGGFFNKLTVGTEFGVVIHYAKCLVGYKTRMYHENVFEFILFRIILIDYFLIVHDEKFKVWLLYFVQK